MSGERAENSVPIFDEINAGLAVLKSRIPTEGFLTVESYPHLTPSATLIGRVRASLDQAMAAINEGDLNSLRVPIIGGIPAGFTRLMLETLGVPQVTQYAHEGAFFPSELLIERLVRDGRYNQEHQARIRDGLETSFAGVTIELAQHAFPKPPKGYIHIPWASYDIALTFDSSAINQIKGQKESTG